MSSYQAHGCAIYTADDWKDGKNRGGRIVFSTALNVIDPDHEDDMPENVECEFAERVARALNSAPVLLAALENLLAHYRTDSRLSSGMSVLQSWQSNQRTIAAAESALALARGSNPVPAPDPREAETETEIETLRRVLGGLIAVIDEPAIDELGNRLETARAALAESEAGK